ncbi:MAG: VacJ family lipoprotein [bacterium]|nr:hypothetical protein [Deltaproteobacteria bacterium]MCP4906854.1 VacJ family lipoprotein [bacterium]
MKDLRFIIFSSALLLLVSLGAGCATPEHPDPWEKMNRGTFAFNEGLDRYALQPAAIAWDFVLPGLVQNGINEFFTNLRMPVVFANDLLQAKPMAAIEDLTRFLQNSIFGLGGFIDVASMVGLSENEEDFGQTLGYWGVPPGPYLMVPILGPYTLRDGFGEIVDIVATSFAYYNALWSDVAGLNDAETAGAVIGLRGLEMLNLRAIYFEELEDSRRDAFDYYVFVRNAYLQNRLAKTLDRTDAAVVDEGDLYFYGDDDFEDGDEEEDYDEF